jgi:nitroreductase/FMN reductase [NAD(P)H]
MNLLNNLTRRFGDTEELCEIENETLRQISARGSCRDFINEKIETSLIKTLCAVALSSPTKSDLQQRDIIIVENQGIRKQINDLFYENDWIHTTPSLLIFCANNRRQSQISAWREKEFANDHLDAFFNASVDSGIALSTFLIAAEAIGLGCCPISAIRNHSQAVSDILQLPEYVFPIAGLALGWPKQPAEISLRIPLQSSVHTDQFSEDNIQKNIESYDARRRKVQPCKTQKHQNLFGTEDNYGWSEDKARQYAVPQREDFGDYIKSRGFKLE